MNKQLWAFVALLLGMVSAPTSVPAQAIPALINYQGMLEQADGQPMPTADYTVALSIWDAPRDGTRNTKGRTFC